MFNEDSKIIKDKKDKTMKQSEFQQTVLEVIGKINIKIDEMDTSLKILKISLLSKENSMKNRENSMKNKKISMNHFQTD